MEWTYSNLLKARTAVDELLTHLDLDAYRFAVEPKGTLCEVSVEYAATSGWRRTTLSVADDELLASPYDPSVRNTLMQSFRKRLTDAKQKQASVVEMAEAAGRAWAEDKAATLRDAIPAVDWPDLWDDADNGRLSLGDQVTEEEQASLSPVAAHAAHERWRELVVEQRELESAEENQLDLEAEASRLEAQLSGDLPQGITVGRDGSRVYLENLETGSQRTVANLEQAFTVLSEWRETRTPHL